MEESNGLVLEIIKQEGALKMSLFEQKEIISTLRHYSQHSVSFEEINKISQDLISLVNKADRKSVFQQELIKGLTKNGQLLWEQLLTRQVKDRLKSTRLSDLILAIDEELITIPWELIYDGSNFLCLNFNIGRLVRTKQEASPAQYRSCKDTLKMLVLANPTDDLKSAYLEGVNIKNQFDRRRSLVHIDFKSTSIDRMYVLKNLCDYDIVHFAGHCEYEARTPEVSGWLLSDGLFSIQDILAMGTANSLPQLIFSNACHSAKESEETLDKDYQEKNYSLASAFLFSGVRHYIGAIRKIEDQVGLRFSREFYEQLLSGKSVGECVRQGRLELMKEYGILSLHWSNYLLYGDPNFILFKKAAKAQVLKAARRFPINKKKLIRSTIGAGAFALIIFLYFWLPSLNPSSYILYLRSQRLFRQGSNQEVIRLAGSIIRKDPTFNHAYQLLGDTYQRVADKENALKSYFDYALYSEKRSDLKSLASAYIGIGWLYHLYGEYPKAFEFYKKASNLAKDNKDKLNEAVVLRKLALWHMDKGDDNTALELLTKSSEINRQRQQDAEFRYNLACDYFNLGLLFSNKDDLATAKEFYQKSLRLFDGQKLQNELSDYYFNLGEICMNEKQYQKAMDCYSKGLSIDKDLNNLFNLPSDYDMMGGLYMEMGNLAEAEKYFMLALAKAEEIRAPLEIASASYDLGLLYKQRGHKPKAREYLTKAQVIYLKVGTPDYQKVKEELISLEKL